MRSGCGVLGRPGLVFFEIVDHSPRDVLKVQDPCLSGQAIDNTVLSRAIKSFAEIMCSAAIVVVIRGDAFVELLPVPYPFQVLCFLIL